MRIKAEELNKKQDWENMALCLEDIIEKVLREVVEDVEDTLNTGRQSIARKVGSYEYLLLGLRVFALYLKLFHLLYQSW